MKGAELHSLDALTDLEDSLRRFKSRVEECMKAVDSSTRLQMSELNRRYEEARYQVRQCEEALCSSDDEDSNSDGEQMLSEAMDRLALTRRWQSAAAESCEHYQAVARSFDLMLQSDLPKAQLLLRTKHEAGSDYLALQLDGQTGIYQAPRAAPVRPSVQPQQVQTPSADRVEQFPLPAGFRWISIEDISPENSLRSDEGFGKVSESDMRRSFGTLRRKILPYLERNPQANSHTFFEMDGYSESGLPQARQKTFEAFFGESPIVLDKARSGGDGKLSVINGRHRIKVAKDLGWTHIPVKFAGNPGK